MKEGLANKVLDMKPSKIGKGEAGAMKILSPKESLTYENCEELEAAFNECINQYKNKIILDCQGISFIDSEGLELLVRIDEKLRKGGGILKIVALNAVCRDIFIATRLINIFHVYKDIYEAIRDAP